MHHFSMPYNWVGRNDKTITIVQTLRFAMITTTQFDTFLLLATA